MTAVEETPELQADLSDVLRMVGKLASLAPMGREGRRTLFALACASRDVERMSGLVVEGEVYDARWRSEWALCLCGDNKHEWRRDAPEARKHWHQTRADAETEVKQARMQHAAWYPNRPVPHLVTHLVATTSTERVA